MLSHSSSSSAMGSKVFLIEVAPTALTAVDCGNRAQPEPQGPSEKQEKEWVKVLVLDTGELVDEVLLVLLEHCVLHCPGSGGGCALSEPRDLSGVVTPGALENPHRSRTVQGTF